MGRVRARLLDINCDLFSNRRLLRMLLYYINRCYVFDYLCIFFSDLDEDQGSTIYLILFY